MTAPLSGIRVVELGEGVALGYAGKLLVDMGADVVKIEPPTGDVTRYLGPYAGETRDLEGSGTFAYLNAGKRSVVFDTASTHAPLEVRQLLNGARIVLHASEDAGFAKHGLSADEIFKDCPRAAVVSITPFGRDTEYCRRPANDLTLQAAGAISLGIGLRGRAPLKLPGDQSAYQAGLCAAIAAASNILARTGAMIDLAAVDIWATLYNGGEVANDYFGRKKQPRAGYRVSRQPYLRAIFPCEDGFFAIQCTETRHWLAFLSMVGKEELATHPLFTDRLKANDEYAEQCDGFFKEWFASRTKEDLLQSCLDSKIPAAPVYDFHEVVEHPHLRDRGYFVTVEVNGTNLRVPGHPFKGMRSDSRHAKRVPRLGEHSPAAWKAHEQRADDQRGDPIRPLRGVRVVDFGWVWAGAIPGHILADLGAEVIRIESRRPLDFMRQGRPIVGHEKDPEQNPVFQNVNRGKLSLCINLTEPGAADVVKELVAKSDIVIENFSPGVMKRFGLGWSRLQAVRSDLIMCSMSAAGQSGPLNGIRTYAAMIAGLAGINSMVGYPGERVLGIQAPPYADPNAGLHATFAILAALHDRRLNGQGVYIDLSQWEAAVNLMGTQVMNYIMNGIVPGTSGTRDSSHAPHGHYPVQGDDKWIAISVTNKEQWQSLQSALRNPAWMREAKYCDSQSRLKHLEELDQELARETKNRDGDELSKALNSAGLPAELLLDVNEILTHPYFQARELFQMIEHPTLKRVPVYRLPWKINSASVQVPRRAPMLGEHTTYVLQSILGRTSQQVADLRNSNIVE